MQMIFNSPKRPEGAPPGWENQIDCPVSVIDIDIEYLKRIELRPRRASVVRQTWGHVWPWLCLLVCSVLSYWFVSQYIVTTVIVQGRSMAPTLTDGDRYLLHRWQLLFQQPTRGDLVVVRDAMHKDFIVKRIIGLPGERIQFKDGAVWVNGERLSEPYLRPGVRTRIIEGAEPLVLIGRERYFVMGDNRDVSEDSRSHGPVTREQILGFIPQ